MTAGIAEPGARLGVILSSSNRMVEPFLRALAPASLAVHVTRMRMAAGLRAGPEDWAAAAIEAAKLLGDAKVDVIDLQATGLIMAAGADAEADLVRRITQATGAPAYTATQALIEAANALGLARVVLITPLDQAANASERAYLKSRGIETVADVGLGTAGGLASTAVAPEAWLEAAKAHDTAEADGFVLSGSNTTMAQAIAPIEQALDKPAVSSVQAALWAGTSRLAARLGAWSPPGELGRLFEIA